MTENEKYYKPALEDFHIGFEYEYRSADGKHWTKCKMEQHEFEANDNQIYNGFDSIVTALPEGGVRVKYLDADDSIELGWKPSQIHKSDRFEMSKPYDDPRKHYDEIYFLYNTVSHWLLVEIGDEETIYSDRVTRFSGIIKNKSELKVLLKQLGA